VVDIVLLVASCVTADGAPGDVVLAIEDARFGNNAGGGYFWKKLMSRGGSEAAALKCCGALMVNGMWGCWQLRIAEVYGIATSRDLLLPRHLKAKARCGALQLARRRRVPELLPTQHQLDLVHITAPLSSPSCSST
jgi:hypothetical protein